MAKKGVFILFFSVFTFLTGSTAISQNHRIDSLIKVIRVSAPDTNLVNTLLTLTTEYSYINTNKALYTGNKALALAFFLKDTISIMQCYSAMGNAYFSTGEYSKAEDSYVKTLKISENTHNPLWLSKCYRNIGNIYQIKNNYPAALNYYQKALRISDSIGNKDGILGCLNNIGLILVAQNNYSLALQHFIKALSIYKSMQNKEPGIVKLYLNMGIVSHKMSRYKETLYYFEKALSLSKNTGNKYEMAISYSYLGKFHSERKHYIQAIKYLNSSVLLFKELGNKSDHFAFSYIYISEILIKLENYYLAIEYLKNALKIAEQTGSLNTSQSAYYNLSIAYDSLDNHKEALKYHILYNDTKDSILNIESQEKLIELQTTYDIEKKDKQLEIQTLNFDKQTLLLKRKNNLISGIIMISALTALILVLLFRQYKLKSIKGKIELQQKLLRTQMNPHFMFNSLLSIQSYIYENKSEDASVYLTRFAELMRLILENSREEYITLNKEIKTIENYIELQKIRYENAFDYSIYIDPALQRDFVLVPPMLAQPFIENAIEHGFAGINNNGLLKISFTLTNNLINFDIQDNGIGYQHSEASKSHNKKTHKSLAIEITKERLYCINKRSFDKKISFKMADLGNSNYSESTGTKVTFTIPCVSEI